jgi:hypothetical protein
MSWPDWKVLLVIVGAVLAITAKWWLPPLLKALEGYDLKAKWRGKAYALNVERPRRPMDDLAPSQADLLASQITSLSYRIAVLNQSTVVPDQEAKAAVAALQTQVHRDLAPVWSVDAQLSLLPRGSQPPPASWLLEILDDTDDAWGRPAYRDLTLEGLPRVKVFARTIQAAGCQWTVRASHQILELLVNPRFNLKVYTRHEQEVFIYSYEICNPCETDEFAYTIGGTLVSDFVYPAWFQSSREANSTQFDYCKHISTPLQILRGAHVNRLKIEGSWQSVAADSPAPMRRRKAKTR